MTHHKTYRHPSGRTEYASVRRELRPGQRLVCQLIDEMSDVNCHRQSIPTTTLFGEQVFRHYQNECCMFGSALRVVGTAQKLDRLALRMHEITIELQRLLLLKGIV